MGARSLLYAATSETKLQRQILARLALVPNAFFMRNSVGSRGRLRFGLGKGSADIVGCYRGRFVAFEVKLPGEKQSDDQVEWECSVAFAKGYYFVVESPQQAVKALGDVETEMKEQEGAGC